MARRTLASTVEVAGAALHRGGPAHASLRPAPAGTGVVFRRADLPDAPAIPAYADLVGAVERRTHLGPPDRGVDTVEHLLAAVTAHRLDDLLVEVTGPELPIGDGSFLPYHEALTRAGAVEQAGEPPTYVVETPLEVTAGGSRYRVVPHTSFTVTATIGWDHPAIGTQCGTFEISTEAFAREVAPARTFGFRDEVEALRARGLALGASLDNAVVLEPDGTASPLRWPDEFLRHKVGDLVGDLALVGGRLRAHVIAEKPSHQGNVMLAQRLRRCARRQGDIAMDIGRILELLPHRYPFLLVDRILEIQGETRIVGVKNVTINEPFFQGHFPGRPIMPGVLIVEALAQCGGVLMMRTFEDPQSKVVYFMSLDEVKFRRPVLPGDQLRLEVELLQQRGGTCRFKGMAYVDGQLATEAVMTARAVDR